MLFGISLPLIVGLLIEALKKVGIIKDGNAARLANIILSSLGALAVSLLNEFNYVAPQMVVMIVAAVYSVLASALGYTAAEKLITKE